MVKSLHIEDIDILRGMSVFGVVLFHLNKSLLPSGFVGVDIFYIISGYVVSLSLIGLEDKKKGSNSYLVTYAEFWKRRIIRIYPSLIFCILTTAFLASLFVPFGFMSRNIIETALYASLGISNIYIAKETGNYFGVLSEYNPFIQTWSLSVEIQFYLIFPILLFLVNWLRQRKLYILAYLSIFSCMILSYKNIGGNDHQDMSFYLVAPRMWEFLIGATLCLSQKDFTFFYHLRRDIVYTLGICIILYSFVFADQKEFPGSGALPACIGGGFFIIAASGNLTQKGLSQSSNIIISFFAFIFKQLGKISYSLYLWHWPVIVLLRWTIGVETPFQIALALTLSLISGFFSYTFIERKLDAYNTIFRFSGIYFFISFMWLIYFASSVLCLIKDNREYLSLSITRNKSIWEPRGWHQKNVDIFNNLVDRQLLVAGDSHAAAYGSMIQKLEDQEGIATKVFQEPGCPVPSIFPANILQCSNFENDTFSKINQLSRSGDVVFFTSLRISRLIANGIIKSNSDILSSMPQEFVRDHISQDMALAEKRIQLLSNKGVKTILELPLPIFFVEPYRCSDWFNRNNISCSKGFKIPRDFFEEYRRPIVERLEYLSSKFDNVYTWDPANSLCDNEWCYSVKNALPYFNDSDHLTALGNYELYESFHKRIMDISGTYLNIPFEGTLRLNEKYLNGVSIRGLSGLEDWGRWSDGDIIELKFSSNLPKEFELTIDTLGFFTQGLSNNFITVSVSKDEKKFEVKAEPMIIVARFRNNQNNNKIQIKIPVSRTPKTLGVSVDDRYLGGRFVSFQIKTVSFQ